MSWLSDQALAKLRDAAATPDLAGTRYRLVRPLGRGGMSAVFLVEDTELGRKVALKILDLPDSSGELAGRLVREARILAQLEHPGIVPVHDVGTLADGRVYYTMKFVEGKRLDEHARRLSLAERLRMFERICEAVAFAHDRGVLHRDLKPGNIMVGPFGEVLVLDWGVAKLLRAAPMESAGSASEAPTSILPPAAPDTAHGSVLGTPGYMAPEQARGEVEHLDGRADVYSLGAILRFLIAGGEMTRPAAPRPLAAICAKAMASEPDGRYASAEELATDVGRYLDGLAVVAYPEQSWYRIWRWVNRNRAWILLVLAYLVVRMILLFVGRR
jgi:serine/threonine protein kinase